MPHVTRLVSEDSAARRLLLQPVGRPFNKEHQLRLHLVLQLLDVLQAIHERGRVHRDLSNMFECDDGVLLNDFGHSAVLGEPVQFGGSLETASAAMLRGFERGELYEPTAADDFVMVVRLCYWLCAYHRMPADGKDRSKPPADRAQAICAFYALMPPAWVGAQTMAEAGDVKSLKDALCRIWTGLP